MTRPTSKQKGDALEAAVGAIESCIISAFPSYSENTFKIEGNKVLRIKGVRHEIDVYVTVELGNGYSSLFIFECKNKASKVDKNDIVIFSEKIAACGAQKGYFVAKTYTSDAVAQAALDKRMQLLSAIELDPSVVEVPGHFHGMSRAEQN